MTLIADSAIDTLWYTRCPVPTASGLANSLGWLDRTANESGVRFGVLQDAGPELAVRHFDHHLSGPRVDVGNIGPHQRPGGDRLRGEQADPGDRAPLRDPPRGPLPSPAPRRTGERRARRSRAPGAVLPPRTPPLTPKSLPLNAAQASAASVPGLRIRAMSACFIVGLS